MGQCSDGTVYADCPICLQSLAKKMEILELPCPGRHRFHGKCLRGWLARSVQCPVCRTNCKELLPPKLTSSVGSSESGGREATSITTLSRAGIARTADGGRVIRYERTPPQEWPRPPHIPAHVRH